MNVKFYFGTQAKYDALVEKDSLALYFIEDTQRLYKGDALLGSGAEVTEKAAGLLSPDDYAQLKTLIAAGPAKNLTPVDGTIFIENDNIGVKVSQTAGNLIAVKSDGLFAAVESVTIDQVTGLKDELDSIKNAAVGGIHYKGNVPTKNDLPADAAQGDMYEVVEDGSEWAFNGEKWFEYGTSHFVPVTGAGIDIAGSTISVKLSSAEGNSLVIAEDNGLFVPKSGFTDKDRVTLDTLPMIYVTADEMNDAISRAVDNNCIAWEELGAVAGVAKIGSTSYPTIQAAIAAANAGDTIQIAAGTYEGIEFTDSTKANLTLLGENGVYLKKIRLVDTANYGAPDGLTLKNIIFNGEGIAASKDNINNLSVIGCTFTNGAVIHINGECVTDGLVVQDCEFEATNSVVNAKEKTAILVQGISKNIIIRNNTIENCEHNGLQVVGVGGSMLVDGNVISNTGSRAMRITTKDGAVLAIMNNTVTNANTNPAEAEANAGEIIKITGSVVDGAMANNTYDGNEIVFNDGIGKII